MLNKKNTSKILIAIIICLGIHLFSRQSIVAQESEIKLLPDFSQISFADLEGSLTNVEIGTENNERAGYDVSRNYSIGDKPSSFLKIGDLEATLAPQQFTLEQIASLSQSNSTNLSSIPLSEFPLVGKQTLKDLVKIVPNLGEKKAGEVKPIAALLEQQGKSNLKRQQLQSIANNDRVSQVELAEVDLADYNLDSIPNLEKTQLSQFADYKNSYVEEVPGLSEVPLGNYPNKIRPKGSIVARIDAVWGSAESDRHQTITGSYVAGFGVPCQSNCEYLELDDIENVGASIQSPFEGDQWIVGRDHKVAGGTGCFTGGREPTGIHPFGDTFKVVLWSTNEVTDSAVVVMFFNIKTNCGESPYFIGPVPFPLGQVRINDYVFIGTNI